MNQGYLLSKFNCNYHFYWSTCAKPVKWTIMYLCVRSIEFMSFYEFEIWFWNCSDSVVIFVFNFIVIYKHILLYVPLCDKNLSVTCGRYVTSPGTPVASTNKSEQSYTCSCWLLVIIIYHIHEIRLIRANVGHGSLGVACVVTWTDTVLKKLLILIKYW